MAESMTLTSLLEQLDDADTGRKIRLRDVVDIFQARGFAPLLVIPALIVLLPTGAVPGVPTLCGLFIATMAIQLTLGKRSPWLQISPWLGGWPPAMSLSMVLLRQPFSPRR